ncbi:MAG: DUF6702 family protein [Nonlabens sp.]|uniref:DUF6702 family protein n=1 Tax=Nonlabens sp. TaxID=1888209 RepID=UPI003EF97FDD
MKNSLMFIFLSLVVMLHCGAIDNVDDSRFRESVTITAHKYYLSVSNVKYSEKAAALQITSRFFIDDLEDVLSARADEEIILTNEGSLDKYKGLIASYFQSRLRTKVDGELIKNNYLGAEVENDQLVLYIEVPVSQEPTEIEMRFTALMELFEEQKNMVHFKIKGQRKTLITDESRKIDSVKF